VGIIKGIQENNENISEGRSRKESPWLSTDHSWTPDKKKGIHYMIDTPEKQANREQELFQSMKIRIRRQ